jgi:hypothetical protein
VARDFWRPRPPMPPAEPITLDQLASIFREAWHAADFEGRAGERVTDGLRAVLLEVGLAFDDEGRLLP